MYIIKKAETGIRGFHDKAWSFANVANVDKTWAEFGAVPHTTGKLLYDDYGIYVRLETDEKPLLARYCNQNDMVCCDSCMELFLRPNENDRRYLVFEFNPFGTMHFAIRTSLTEAENPVQDRKFFNVDSRVDDKSWVLSFCIPFSFIDEKFGGHTGLMFGNLYKCGEDLPQKHYASYYPIHLDKPAFHRPEFFGEFMLEQG